MKLLRGLLIILFLLVAACSSEDRDPKAVNLKPDPRIQRAGDGAQKTEAHSPALP